MEEGRIKVQGSGIKVRRLSLASCSLYLAPCNLYLDSATPESWGDPEDEEEEEEKKKEPEEDEEEEDDIEDEGEEKEVPWQVTRNVVTSDGLRVTTEGWRLVAGV